MIQNKLKSYTVLMIILVFSFLMLQNDSAQALGDDQYRNIRCKINEIKNENIQCILEVSCNAQCFWDRVIEVETGHAIATMAPGPSNCEIVGYNLNARKMNDYKIVLYGEVQVKTTDKYTWKQAKNVGLIDVGFDSDSKNIKDTNKYYYFKTITFTQELQP